MTLSGIRTATIARRLIYTSKPPYPNGIIAEVSVSAGVLGDSFSTNGDTEIAPYVTLNWLTQF